MMSESQTIDEDAAMQRLLTEAYAEFEFEEPAKVPGSEYVKRCPKETDKQSRGASTGAEAPQPEQRRLNRIGGASTESEAPQPNQSNQPKFQRDVLIGMSPSNWGVI